MILDGHWLETGGLESFSSIQQVPCCWLSILTIVAVSIINYYEHTYQTLCLVDYEAKRKRANTQTGTEMQTLKAATVTVTYDLHEVNHSSGDGFSCGVWR